MRRPVSRYLSNSNFRLFGIYVLVRLINRINITLDYTRSRFQLAYNRHPELAMNNFFIASCVVFVLSLSFCSLYKCWKTETIYFQSFIYLFICSTRGRKSHHSTAYTHHNFTCWVLKFRASCTFQPTVMVCGQCYFRWPLVPISFSLIRISAVHTRHLMTDSEYYTILSQKKEAYT